MRIPSPGDTDLLVPLHDGLFEMPMWRTFLTRLAREAGAERAVLILRPAEGLDVIALWSDDAAIAEQRGFDLRTMKEMREGRVYSLAELGAIDLPGDLRAMHVRESGGMHGWLILAGQGFGAAVAALMTALAPHLRAALRVFAALDREKMRATLSADAIRRVNFGWISLDARCRIVDLDPQAERVLQRSGVLRRGAYDRLTPASPAVDRELTDLVKRFAADPDERPRAISLSRDPWTDLLVAPQRMRSIAAGAQTVAVVYLSGDRRSTADRCEQLAELFGLTNSEAKLAWAMAQGATIAEAAAECGLTVETARNYSKRIYAKTGARGQADLVRHILRSVLALA
jgi:DNA-binding CsgD family transcriptional regulator